MTTPPPIGKRRRRPGKVKPIKQRHQTRTLILTEIAQAGELTPRDLAARIGQTLGTVSYHVRALYDAGQIDLTRTTQVRGAIAHHYQLTTPALEQQIADLVKQRDEITSGIEALRRVLQDRGAA